ncbi:MAG: hypothetical protein K2J08_08735 [Ruminococcus sp.]|nr:hypothetical protein [Ruminococcus sp.]
MIKGVNRKIVEINHPDSIYFERAVFYLRPEVRELPNEISRAEAERYIRGIIPEYRWKPKKKRLFISLLVCIAVALSVMIITFI